MIQFLREEFQEDEMRIMMEPMIDCVFLLIIFFLTTTTFIKLEQDLSINLPTMSQRIKTKVPSRPIVVNVRYLPGGKAYYHVDNEPITLPALTVNLSRARMRDSEQPVVIRGDKQVIWDQIAAVMACCAQAGITKVSATVEVRE